MAQILSFPKDAELVKFKTLMRDQLAALPAFDDEELLDLAIDRAWSAMESCGATRLIPFADRSFIESLSTEQQEQFRLQTEYFNQCLRLIMFQLFQSLVHTHYRLALQLKINP